MKKEDQFRKSNEDITPNVMFEDADYEDGMRTDPLTTREAMRKELASLRANKEARDKQAAEIEAAKKAEEQDKAEYERLRKKFTDDEEAHSDAD